ncbi:MAG: AraC family transcriptional regulator [Flavobacteriaceae bacterium]|nr:AraC family transcriptional regulator [Flavobacteriaceae bacterium]
MTYIEELLKEKKKEFATFKKGFKLIETENLFLAASCEADIDSLEPIGKNIYYPYTSLLYLEKGELEITHDGVTHILPEGYFYLVRKCTDAYVQSRKSIAHPLSIAHAFAIYDHSLKNVISKIPKPSQSEKIEAEERIFRIASHENLYRVMETVKYAIEEELEIDTNKMEELVLTTLQSIAEASPKHYQLFYNYAKHERIDLETFMNRNFYYKYNLEQFAMISGRSLSTFHREFRSIFGTTPHQWLLKKRLHWADTLLRTTNRSVSEVAFEMSFEDLAHFSKAYKKEFGRNPSNTRITEPAIPLHSFVPPTQR